MSTDLSLDHYLDVEEREARSVNKGTVRKLLGFMLGHRPLLALGLALMLVATAATLAEPRLFGYAIDEAIVPKVWTKLKALTLIFFIVESVRVASFIAQAYVFETLGQRVMQELRLALFSHMQALPLAVYDRNPVGRLVTRVTNDVSALAEMFSAGFVTMFGNILVVVGILIWILVLDLKLGLIAASIFPVLVLASIYFSGKLRIAYREARSKLSALNAFLAENILGMKIVHLFNRQKLHSERFARVNLWYSDAQVSTIRVFAYFQPAITWCAGIAVALVIWYGGQMTLAGTIKIGVLVAYFSYVLALFQPVREIADKWNIFLSGMASAERIFSILDWAPELDVSNTFVESRPIKGLRGHIVFENVWFAYNSEHWVLKNLSFEIAPGQRVGVVGHTGAGKTTLISLLMRFYEPQKGRILLDGKDLREYDKRSLRSSIGIVQQDVFLFSGSVDENVYLWRPRPEQDLQPLQNTPSDPELLTHLGLKRDNTALEERGSNLSMGERQVMAFARALAAKPSLWILDEATANIDSGSEEKLNEALANASQGRTTILIAHRLATIRSASRILVLHRGQLSEQGNHTELLAMNGLYARLYRYQESFELPT